MTLILVRHGQTESNIRKALDTRPPGPPLTELGRAQAAGVAALLAEEPLSAVYASTAVRAQETAAPIAARHGLPVTVLPGVHEVSCGDLEGRSDAAAREVFDEVYAAWAAGESGRKVPGGESADDLLGRFLPAVARLWQAHREETYVLVSHGAAIRIAAGALVGDGVETDYVPNAGRVVLTPQSGAPGAAGWLLKFWEEGEVQPGDVTGGADD